MDTNLTEFYTRNRCRNWRSYALRCARWPFAANVDRCLARHSILGLSYTGINSVCFYGTPSRFLGYSLMKRPAWNGINMLNPFNRYHWVWTASLTSGLILLIWIATETLLIGYESILQPIMAAWGILIILLTLLPNVRRLYERKT